MKNRFLFAFAPLCLSSPALRIATCSESMLSRC